MICSTNDGNIDRGASRGSCCFHLVNMPSYSITDKSIIVSLCLKITKVNCYFTLCPPYQYSETNQTRPLVSFSFLIIMFDRNSCSEMKIKTE